MEIDQYKLAFIHGDHDLKNGIEDGKLEFYGGIEEENLHIKYLLKYVKERYPETKIFEQMNEKHQPEAVGYILTLLNHIVFFNTTKYDEGNLRKYGRTGFFMVPNVITKKQEVSLMAFAKTIPSFDICILYEITLSNGLLDSKTIQDVTTRVEPTALIEHYLLTREKGKVK